MTTVAPQPSAAQPMFLPPGAAAAPPMLPMAVPGSVTPYYLYDPQMAGGTGVIMVNDCMNVYYYWIYITCMHTKTAYRSIMADA